METQLRLGISSGMTFGEEISKTLDLFENMKKTSLRHIHLGILFSNMSIEE